MVYRLLAVNIDGTILQDNGRLNKMTKEAIEYAQEKGIYICLVSGRHYPSVKKVAKSLKVDSCLIAHQGAFVAKQLDKPILLKRIQEDITYELTRFLESFHCRICLSHEKFSVSNKMDLPDSLVGRTVWQRTNNRMLYPQYFVESVRNYLEKEPVSPPKMEIIFQNPRDLEDAKKAIEGMYDEVAVIRTDQNRFDIVPSGVSKFQGLVYLCERINVSLKEVVMIGSGIDDLPLLHNAGLGVAMGNAPDQVKEAADWVTRSNQENGVSYVVKELFRRQRPIRFLEKMDHLK
ncbi:Cof-type HAD-IIB family hydrolase [Bacillus smithii]|uniref:Cof-like hydrolase n=1 Tax=Bacillus smithii 7_3_47FAA TaxID=665952 RepID=G9QKD8_9BACI|nr:Cof-type HAD-IIB family hydrolase [Bacillus smithii]EHL78388.1 cof-like hydrolase [Bacillus smithii 7_3_47FAA]